MWISKPESLKRLKPPELDDIVELGDGDTAQVTADVGELFIEKYDDITEHNPE